jgi:ring-1,2-phenylacetyl-CoA epoxidase subunit PaaC
MSPFKAGLPGASDEVTAAFRRLLVSLADSKRILGIRYSDWLLGAPSIEAGIAASSMAQDEWGHARLLYATLKDFGEDPVALEHDRPADAYASVEALDEPFADWAAFIAGVVVVDGALAVSLEGLLEGGYESIDGRVGKMLGEEEFHQSLGEAWFRRLAGGTEEGRGRLRSAVEAMAPSVFRAVAPGDEAHQALAEVGLTLSADELHRRLADRLAPFFQLLDLQVPARGTPAEDWDPVRGRGVGHPAEEAVEQARGDRNRALFVE